MARPDSKQSSTFFWQGLLILLPVGLLAGLGFFLVRQDKLIAEHEAVVRAQNIADELLPKLWAELADTNHLAEDSTAGFQVDAAGQLLRPPPAPLAPTPLALDLSALNADQRRLWLSAQAAEVSSNDMPSAALAYRDFLAANPPASFNDLAQYSLGLLLFKTGDREAARSCFEEVWEKDPASTGESGLPLKPLAGLKLLEVSALAGSAGGQAEAELLNNLCSNVVWNPTPLSAEILARVPRQTTEPEARAAAARWQQMWMEHERSRELFAAASQVLGRGLSPGSMDPTARQAFWFATPEALPVRLGPGEHRVATGGPGQQQKSGDTGDEPTISMRNTLALDRLKERGLSPSWPALAAMQETDQSWLALRAANSTTNVFFVCRARSDISARLTTVVAEAKGIPEYFSVGLDVGGKRLTWPAPDLREWEYQNYFGREGGGQKKVILPNLSTNVLASAVLDGRGDLLKVSVYLTSRSALLAREQTRSFWLAALVGSAALAAGLGFIKAYRAFHRQLWLSELKSNFVSSVSHELRAPIASVRLMAESLERGKVPEPGRQREYFKFIVQECRRLSSLVENVLDFSRIEQGRKQYDFEATDLRALVQQTVRLMEPYAAERQISLELRVENAAPETSDMQLNADGKALQQALVNLVDNAIKHSPSGQSVTVGLERRTGVPPVSGLSGLAAAPENGSDAGGSAVVLWVEDHGSGIPASEHEKIFERFYRRGSELRRETQGVGIGLSIVKHIVEAHRGRVEVSSKVGQGSRFTIVLPVS